MAMSREGGMLERLAEARLLAILSCRSSLRRRAFHDSEATTATKQKAYSSAICRRLHIIYSYSIWKAMV
jgi:hypothetical protein